MRPQSSNNIVDFLHILDDIQCSFCSNNLRVFINPSSKPTQDHHAAIPSQCIQIRIGMAMVQIIHFPHQKRRTTFNQGHIVRGLTEKPFPLLSSNERQAHHDALDHSTKLLEWQRDCRMIVAFNVHFQLQCKHLLQNDLFHRIPWSPNGRGQGILCSGWNAS